MNVISSPHNRHIKLASRLKLRKYRDELELFLVEGKRAVEEALARPDLLEILFVDRDWEELPPLELVEFPHSYRLESGLMKQVCAADNPQGIAAIMKKPAWSWTEMVEKRGLLLVLDRITDPGNLGSILRTGWAFGVEGVLLTKGCVDLFSPKVVRSSMGAILNVPVFTDISTGQLVKLHEAGYQFLCSDVNEGKSYHQVTYDGSTVIILGSEGQGVSEEVKKLADQMVIIPMKIGVDSLNVASACAIIMAEAWRQHEEV